MDSGYLDGCTVCTEQKRGGGPTEGEHKEKQGGRELCTIAHVMKLRLVAELTKKRAEQGDSLLKT